MTGRLVFLGNSHLRALQDGATFFETDREAVFFKVPGTAFSKTRALSPNRFGVSDTAGLTSHERDLVMEINGDLSIRIEAEDTIVFAGDQTANRAFVTLVAGRSIDAIRELGSGPRLSAAAFEAFCESIAATDFLSARWKGLNAKQVCVVRGPCMSETIQDADPELPYLAEWRQIARVPDGFARAFEQFNVTYAKTLGENGIEFVPQPAKTLTDAGLTAAKWKLAPEDVRSKTGRTLGDHAHMNADYGKLVLKGLFEKIGVNYQQVEPKNEPA